MPNQEMESLQSQEAIKALLKNINISTLIKIKKNVDKEKLNTFVMNVMSLLKKSLPPKDYESLSEIVNSLMNHKEKPQ